MPRGTTDAGAYQCGDRGVIVKGLPDTFEPLLYRVKQNEQRISQHYAYLLDAGTFKETIRRKFGTCKRRWPGA